MDFSILIAFIFYFALVLAIGFYFFNKNKSASDYFLGGRNLNSWVTAMSAQASDMSGWLLMGLPAAAYISGISAGWIALGLAVGTYLNWKFVAARLRRFSAASGDSITIPEYLQNRFASSSPAARIICAVIIFIFFTVYTASAFSAGAKLFKHVFGLNYVAALTIGALIIISYTFAGGFSAVCWTDFVQGVIMFAAIIVVPVMAIVKTPDFSIGMLANIRENFLNPFAASDSGAVSVTAIISNLAWGLGYFGMPHIIVRFMAIKSSDMIKKSRIIAMIWVVISLSASIAVGLTGVAYLNSVGESYATASAAEVVFMDMIMRLAPGLLAGILLSAIMAAVMSTADSQLLVAASAVSNDLFKPIYNAVTKKEPSDKKIMLLSRAAVIAIAVIAYIVAFDPESSVMNLVSYAWAGFGAAFGPVILLSLYWKHMSIKGAAAGMISGGATVLIWEALTSAGVGVVSDIYSIIPGFALSLIAVIVFSLTDRNTDKQKQEEFFEKAKTYEL